MLGRGGGSGGSLRGSGVKTIEKGLCRVLRGLVQISSLQRNGSKAVLAVGLLQVLTKANGLLEGLLDVCEISEGYLGDIQGLDLPFHARSRAHGKTPHQHGQ